MLQKNEIYEAVVTDYTAEGQGVAHVEGCAVFLPNAICGERYKIRIEKAQKTWAAGKIVEVLEKSPHRVNRECPVAKLCGGCDFWHMDYEEETRLKAERVRQTLSRIGGENLEEVSILAAPTCYGYRNKAQYPVASKKGRAYAGFFRAGTHQVVENDRCLILPQETDRVKNIVIDYVNQYRITAYDEETHKGLLRHIYVRRGVVSREILVCLVVNGRKLPHIPELIEKLKKIPGFATLVLAVNTHPGNAILGNEFITLYGPGYIEDTLCGLKFRLSPRSFYQVNHHQAQRLYEAAITQAEITKDDLVLDLYCGVGTITLAMAKAAGKVIGVEVIEQAVEDAKDNAKRNGIENVEFFCGDAGKAALELETKGIKPDVIVVDPPRKGLNADTIEALHRMSPRRIVYVSCDPATLARDVALLKERGYTLKNAMAADLFPRCAHVETVVCLSREKADESEKESNMISDERSKYKSWSNLKKQMNNLLCDSLKDKITYFYTSYNEVNNAYGRATINCNKKELVAFSWDIGYAKWDDEYTVLNETNVNIQTLGSFQAVWDEQKRVQEELNKSKWMPEGKLCETDFINAVTNYLKTDITTSLRSDNYLLRIFAYMDRRVGKRTLVKIQDEVEKLPDWVKQFYQIRCEADGIVFPPKRNTDESVACLSREKANAPSQNFRIAQQDDAEHVLSLYQSAKSSAFCVWNDSYPYIAEIEHDLETKNLYVMTDGSKVIGAISVVPENELDDFDCWSCKDGKEIARVVIDRAYQGRGLSFEMVQRIESVLREKGHISIRLSVVKSNIPAYKTYIKAGFAVVGEAQMYGNDYYLMDKVIDTTSLPKRITDETVCLLSKEIKGGKPLC